MKNIIASIVLILLGSTLHAQTFTLASADLGGQFTQTFIAGNFGCNGSNLSPELHWSNPPANTRSFAVTMYDMDAPTGSGFWHWVLTDIPASVHQLKRGAGSADAQTGASPRINDTGQVGYQGPCPGEGEAPHRYLITVYALANAALGADSRAPAALTGFLLNKAAIAKASLIVYCKR